MKAIRNIIAFTSLFSLLGASVSVSAATFDPQTSHRQKTKNDWRNLGYLSGAAGLLGLLKGDRTLMFVGAAGAFYSLTRYEQDRKSQSRTNRARAAMFGKKSFTRDGVKYVRHMTTRNGKKYYYFARA